MFVQNFILFSVSLNAETFSFVVRMEIISCEEAQVTKIAFKTLRQKIKFIFQIKRIMIVLKFSFPFRPRRNSIWIKNRGKRVGYVSAPPIRRRRFGAGHFGAGHFVAGTIQRQNFFF